MELQRTPLVREILVTLTATDAEWASKSMTLLQLIKDEESLKQQRRALSHAMKEAVGARNKTVKEMKDGSTYKKIDCEEIKNFSSETQTIEELDIEVQANHAVIVRLDNNQIIESRLMEWTELQMDLLPEDGEDEEDGLEDEPGEDPEAEDD